MAATIPARLSLFCQPWCLLVLWALLSSCLVHDVLGQTVVNGQIYTAGLAILDAPQMGSTLQVGGTMNIAMDISGNGKISVDSSAAGSTDATRITFLEAYLISEQTATNLTVVRGSSFLQGESGSTVKHSSFTVPSCAAPGAYGLTIYETSVINGTDFFSITSIPIRITTSRPGGNPCSTLFNNILPLPQVSSPPLIQPWLGIAEHLNPSSSSQTISASTSQTSDAFTSTQASSPSPSQGSSSTSNASSSQASSTSDTTSPLPTSSASDSSSIDTSASSSGTLSVGSDGLVTITKTEDGATTTRTVTSKPSTITRVLSSVRTEVTTLTQSGTTEVLTTTEATVSTATEVVGGGPSSVSGFFPVVNAATLPSFSVPALASIPFVMYLALM